NRSAISDVATKALGAVTVARTEVVTPTGRDVAATVRLDRVTVGPVTCRGILAVVLPVASLEMVGKHIDGIIGQDFLLGLEYTIDYQRRQILWGDSGVSVPDSKARLPLTVDQGRYLVDLAQETGNGAPLRLVPDTGASGFVLFRRTQMTRAVY